MQPFRWNITRREQLGRLVERAPGNVYASFAEDIRLASARVIAAAGDAGLLFVGRSPETLFDYLSGILAETSWFDRLLLLNISMRYMSPDDIERENPASISAFAEHLAALGIAPEQIASAPQPLALVDLVSSGSTFKHVTELILGLAKQDGIDRNAVRRRMRFVGLTWRRKNSPNTYRWQQHADWLEKFPGTVVRNVSIPGRLWDYLGNRQEKVIPTNPPWRWADAAIAGPPREEEHLLALRRALDIYDLGSSKLERQKFSERLARQQAMREPWCRGLVGELRKKSAQA
ncbi:MAG: hypothetical protein KJO31_11415 [Gammaproteobacteria bacterium]|nr:hypothetical protein [Gammaproteobacteria bacterium]